MPPPTIGFQVVRLGGRPLINLSRVTRILLLSGGISMKLATFIMWGGRHG